MSGITRRIRVGIVGVVLISAAVGCTTLANQAGVRAGSTSAKCHGHNRFCTTTTTARPTSTTARPTSTTARPTSTTTVVSGTTTTTVKSGSWGCSDSLSRYGPDGTKYELFIDAFNPVQPFSDVICGNNTNFYADVKTGECGGCVQAYPSIKYRYDQVSWVGCCGVPGGSVPISLMRSWNSSWSVSYDRTTNSQAAYDLWFNNNCGALHGDAMVWVDTTASRGTGGGPIRNPHLQLDGRDVTLMQYGTPGSRTSETIFKFNTNAAVGDDRLVAGCCCVESDRRFEGLR